MRILWLSILIAGCGSDSITGLEGIYTVSTWTRNPTACDAEGPSTAAQHDMFFYIKDEDFVGSHFLNVESCPDVSMCNTEANDDGTIHIGEFNFDKGGDKSGWTSHNAFAFAVQGQCEGGVTDTKLTSTSGTIRIEQRHVEGTPFPASTSGDSCPDDKVETAAAGKPCTELEVVTATFNTKF